jgi:threonylcarbamoyladenosine tRNA methylthiotransferase MtaB
MPHFHLSLQAGDDMILKRMKRRHSRAEAVATVERLKARGPTSRSAPTSSPASRPKRGMALNSAALLDDCDIVAAHIFPFSPRPNTPAARMPQVSASRQGPRRALREAAARARARWLEGLVGTRQPVLIENSEQGPQRQFRAGPHPGRARGGLRPQRAHHRPRRRSPGRDFCMSWLDRLRGGFKKTADRLGDNLTGLFTKARRSTPRRSTTSRRR